MREVFTEWSDRLPSGLEQQLVPNGSDMRGSTIHGTSCIVIAIATET